jgi:hypothetical protein
MDLVRRLGSTRQAVAARRRMIEPRWFSCRRLQFATGEQCRADHAGVPAMPGEADRGVRAEAGQDILERDAASGLEQGRVRRLPR